MSQPNTDLRGLRRPSIHRASSWCAALGLSTGCLAPSFTPTFGEPAPLRMQTPVAESVGTSTNLKLASRALLRSFDEVATDKGEITRKTLAATIRPESAGTRNALQNAVRFFFVSPVARRLAGEGDGHGMTRAGLESAMKAAEDPKLDEVLQSWTDPKGRADLRFDRALLSDPGVPDAVRRRLVARFNDQQLLAMIGRPNAQGDERDKRDETTAFLFLIRLSWLGAAEAEAIVKYRVPYFMARGKDDNNISYWNGHKVQLSEVMMAGRKGAPVNDEALVKHIGTFAHESGHALYALSGVQKKFEADFKRAGLEKTQGTRGVPGVVNEGMAGVFQNRAGIAARGFGSSKDTDEHLSIENDIVENNLHDDQRYYAKYYHVDTREARAELPALRQLIANDLIPWFETEFRLLDDPQLTLNLPPARIRRD